MNHNQFLADLVRDAIYVENVKAESGFENGFIEVMSHKNIDVRKDIPIAFEMYSLLTHFLDKIQVTPATLDETKSKISKNHSVEYDVINQRVLLMIKTDKNELPYVAHWISDRLPSAHVKELPGILVIPFMVETWNEKKYLVPEWFAAYYIDGIEDHCVPILVMQSILENDQFGGDWVSVAINRMMTFGLPVEKAKSAINTKKER